jgi:hypothetical protein
VRATRTGESFCRVQFKSLDMLKWLEQVILPSVNGMSLHEMYVSPVTGRYFSAVAHPKRKFLTGNHVWASYTIILAKI